MTAPAMGSQATQKTWLPSPARLHRHGLAPEFLLPRRYGGLGMADGQAAARVEELQVAGVDGQLERLPVPDPALLGHPGRPERLAAGQGGGGLVLVLAGLGGL